MLECICVLYQKSDLDKLCEFPMIVLMKTEKGFKIEIAFQKPNRTPNVSFQFESKNSLTITHHRTSALLDTFPNKSTFLIYPNIVKICETKQIFRVQYDLDYFPDFRRFVFLVPEQLHFNDKVIEFKHSEFLNEQELKICKNNIKKISIFQSNHSPRLIKQWSKPTKINIKQQSKQKLFLKIIK